VVITTGDYGVPEAAGQPGCFAVISPTFRPAQPISAKIEIDLPMAHNSRSSVRLISTSGISMPPVWSVAASCQTVDEKISRSGYRLAAWRLKSQQPAMAAAAPKGCQPLSRRIGIVPSAAIGGRSWLRLSSQTIIG
jgi:hypothetical protein